MQLQTAVAQDAATQENTRRHVIRLAAGVVDTIGLRTPEGRHFGRFICADCPRERHVPPYLPFGLDSHRREHLERHPGHQVKFYCFDHCTFEDDGDLLTLPQPWDIAGKVESCRRRQNLSPQVQVALEVLRRAGYLPPTPPPLLPPPEPLLFTHGEAEVLKLVRAHPGTLTREIAAARGLERSTITAYLVGLHKGRHVRLEIGRWYPVGDRAIGKVTAKEKVRWVRRPSGP